MFFQQKEEKSQITVMELCVHLASMESDIPLAHLCFFSKFNKKYLETAECACSLVHTHLNTPFVGFKMAFAVFPC
jgi:hypothetical protein